MPKPQDDEFLRFAVASGQVSQEQAEEALAALREVEQLGGSSSAAELLLNRGVVSEAQAERLHQAIASSKAATKVPRELGGFELLEKIGQGGMGSVFKARQKELDRVVALKVLSPRLSRNSEFVARFLREARSAGKLNHPNIVAAIDVGEDEGFYYFAMEYVDGETLAMVLAREGRLPEARALAIATDVARALDHAHHKGLIHRDIKPDNVMVTADGRARVTDFGLARAIDPDEAGADVDRFMGTPSYVAPEQIRSEADIDCRGDIFSLGITLFEMLTGEVPFRGANPMAVAATILTEPLPSIRKLRSEVSAAAERIVGKMTAKERQGRYATPADAIAALEQAAKAPRTTRAAPRGAARPRPRASTRPAARRAAPRRPGRSVGLVVGIAAGIGILATLTYMLVASRKPHGDRGPRVVAPPPPTSRVVTPTPRDETGKTLYDQLSKAVAGADSFAKLKPRAYVSRLARLERIRQDFAKTHFHLPPAGAQLYQQVRARIGSLEQEAEAAAAAELTRQRTRAEAALKDGKLAEALAAVAGFPKELAIASVAPKAQRLQAQIRQRVIAEFQKLDVDGRRLIKQGSLKKARALYAAVADSGVPEITRRAREALGEIDKLLAAQGDKAERVAREAYVLTAQAVLDHLAARRYDDARKLLDAAVVEPQLASVRERLRELLPLVRAAAEVWGHVAGGMRRLKPGQAVRVAGVGGEFLRVKGGKVYLRSGSVTMARPLTELHAAEAVGFAQSSMGAPAPQHDIKLGLFLLADRDYDGARARLAAAKAKGVDVAAAADLVVRLAPRTCARCKGEGTIPCPDCGGKGHKGVDRKPCDACNGEGKFECPKCNGAGSFTCPVCKGTGQEFKGLRCANCGGRGKIRCSRCKGSGHMKCKKCRGTGILGKPIPCEGCKGKKAVTCPECGSQGSFPAPDLVPPSQKK